MTKSVSQDKIDFVTKESWYPDIPVLYDEKVLRLTSSGKFDDNSMIIIPGTIIFVRNSMMKKMQINHQYYIPLIRTITLEKKDTIVFDFGNEKLTIKSKNAADIIRIVAGSYYVANYGVISAHSIEIVNFSSNDIIPEARPKNSLYMRAISYSFLHKQRIPQKTVKYLQAFDENPQSELVLPPDLDVSGCEQIIAKAFAQEHTIKKLSLDEFAPNQLPSFLSSYLRFASYVETLEFANYETSSGKFNFDLSNASSKSITNLIFNNCVFNLPSKLLPAFCMLKSDIKEFKMINCPATKKLLSDIMKYFITLHCFGLLERVIFDGVQISGFSIDDFSATMCQMNSLKYLMMRKFDFDGSKLLEASLLKCSSLTNLDLSHNVFSSGIDILPEDMPDSIRLINISNSTIKASSFRQIITTICSKEREKGIIFNASDVAIAEGSENLLYDLDFSTFKNAIIDLEWNGIQMTTNDTIQFIKLLKTQPGLLHLGIDRCFKRGFDSQLKIIADYITQSMIKGISIRSMSDKPMGKSVINFIININGLPLRYIDISDAKFGDEGFKVLNAFLDNTPTIEELGVDGLSPSSLEFYVVELESILAHQNIMYFDYPSTDLESVGVVKGKEQRAFKHALEIIELKKKKTSFDERLEIFEKQEDKSDGNLLLKRRKTRKSNISIGSKTMKPKAKNSIGSPLRPNVGAAVPNGTVLPAAAGQVPYGTISPSATGPSLFGTVSPTEGGSPLFDTVSPGSGLTGQPSPQPTEQDQDADQIVQVGNPLSTAMIIKPLSSSSQNIDLTTMTNSTLTTSPLTTMNTSFGSEITSPFDPLNTTSNFGSVQYLNLMTTTGLFTQQDAGEEMNFMDEFQPEEDSEDEEKAEYTTLDGLSKLLDDMGTAICNDNVCCGDESDPYVKALNMLEIM